MADILSRPQCVHLHTGVHNSSQSTRSRSTSWSLYAVLQLMKILGRPADHPVGTLGGPHNFLVVRLKNIEKKKKNSYFDNHMSNMAASSETIGHGLWQKKFLGCQSDKYLVISVSPDRFIGRIWRLLSCNTVYGNWKICQKAPTLPHIIGSETWATKKTSIHFSTATMTRSRWWPVSCSRTSTQTSPS